MLGPFPQKALPTVQCSPLGVIPKGSSGKWRLILNLSAPEGLSVNDGIALPPCSSEFVGVADAALEVARCGCGTLMGKVDVKTAYRNIPIHPNDWWLLGMRWEGGLFVDTTLPFGLPLAPKIFTAVADGVERILKAEGVDFVIHYLDDFFVVGAPNSYECEANLLKLLEVFARLGLPVAVHKLEGLEVCLTFLGFELDSVAMELRLPVRKLCELQELISAWQGRRSCLRSELESLVGKLAHACTVVRPGKTFLRRMFELLSGVRQPYHHIRLNVAFRSDLMWWVVFLETWNGVSLLRMFQPAPPTVQFVSDASGSFGCGAVSSGC